MIYHSPRFGLRRGLASLELTVVLTILLALISVLALGSRAWLRDCDRASCILTLHKVQLATRSYQNLYGYSCGGSPNLENGSYNIAEHLHAKGYIAEDTFQQTHGALKCPRGGIYTCPLPDHFPATGQLYMTCSLAESEDHRPTFHGGW